MQGQDFPHEAAQQSPLNDLIGGLDVEWDEDRDGDWRGWVIFSIFLPFSDF